MTTYLHLNEITPFVQKAIIDSKLFDRCLKYLSNKSIFTVNLATQLLLKNPQIIGFIVSSNHSLDLGHYCMVLKNFYDKKCQISRFNMKYINESVPFKTYVHSVGLPIHEHVVSDRDFFDIIRDKYSNLPHKQHDLICYENFEV
ncbi:hypothetical protein [Neodiprion sertifer nucleopolyhedrovirus]|uniref:Uncharacterized protein n=1 Tax=Neodiprion sertifer nucleopolyhedrovirus TaxID=111874 RepID=Q6JK82_9CBAC|nr:hypothetical protein NeseNPV_gp78 [Neodiprion sertifer nucleopolyhedrovirus]AAQ96455.1 hypothetical protein [Neodiprion sertifer nucleopolyhedrovirus]